MSDMDLSKTMGYDNIVKDGRSVLRKSLAAANYQAIDGEILRDLNQLFSEMATSIGVNGGSFSQTAALTRLYGYLQEMATVIGLLPEFGFSFSEDEKKNLSITFNPKRLDHDFVKPPPVGLEKVGS